MALWIPSPWAGPIISPDELKAYKERMQAPLAESPHQAAIAVPEAKEEKPKRRRARKPKPVEVTEEN